jgi:fructokinase
MKSSNIVVGMGEILWDIYPDSKKLGGAPANAALHAARFGTKSIVVSSIGMDQQGDEIVETLKNQCIQTAYLQRCPDRPTGTVGIKLIDGIPEFSCSKDVAFDYILWDEKLDRLAESSDIVFIGTLAQRNRISYETIQKFLKQATNTIRVFDVNFRGWNKKTKQIVENTLPYTDILKVNEDEAKIMKKAFGHDSQYEIDFINWLIEEFSLHLAALSRGNNGCVLSNGKNVEYSQGVPVEVVDTTGCGDAFVAALAMKYTENVSLKEIADFANHLGAFTATMKGAVPDYTITDFKKFINR